MATRLAPYQLDPLMTATEWLPEPPLAFASGNHHPDPKVGIALYGLIVLAERRLVRPR